MTKSYKLSQTQVNFMLVVGTLLLLFGLYFIAHNKSSMLLVMGAGIIIISFVHRARYILSFTEQSVSFSPNFFGTKEMLFAEIKGVTTQRGKIIVSGVGKVKQLKISISAFSKQDREAVIAQLNALQPVVADS